MRSECVNSLKTKLRACLKCDAHAVNINCCCYHLIPVGNWIWSRGTWVPALPDVLFIQLQGKTKNTELSSESDSYGWLRGPSSLPFWVPSRFSSKTPSSPQFGLPTLRKGAGSSMAVLYFLALCLLVPTFMP